MIVKHIGVPEAEELLKDESVSFIDMREEKDFIVDHPDNCINLSYEQLVNFITNSDKSSPVVVMCYHGISSIKIGELLISKGFEEVYSISGGYEAWKKEQNDISKKKIV